MNNSSNLSKILNGINNTLNIVNKAMPIYKQAKPVFNTIKSTYSNIKNNKDKLSKMFKLLNLKNQIQKNTIIQTSPTYKQKNTLHKINSNINNPKFFI